MSYASEEQWEPIICPICDSNIWVMGDKAKPHHCDADPDDVSFDPQIIFSRSLQDMAKQILGIK